MNEPTTFGPYETERDTHAAPLYAAWRDLPRVGVHDFHAQTQRSRDLKLNYLVAACGTAGVALGAYDERILIWLAGYETATVQVVIGLISRAYAAGAHQHIETGIPHTFKGGYSGMSCIEMVELSDSTGDQCGRPASEHAEPGRGANAHLLPRCEAHKWQYLNLDCPSCAALRRKYYQELEQGGEQL